jgi:hypothetical protein
LEEIIVLSAHRFIGSLLLAGAIFAPTAIMAAPLPQEGIQVRVYDSHHRDYHNWDDREDHAYRGYLTSKEPEISGTTGDGGTSIPTAKKDAKRDRCRGVRDGKGDA